MSEYEGKYNPRDFLGKQIEVGHVVVYPVRRRSDMVLKSARVSVVNTVKRPIVQGSRARKLVVDHLIEAVTDSGRRVTLRRPERLVIVEG